MATKIQAVQKYGPRISAAVTASMDEMSEFMMRNSGQSRGEVKQGVSNFCEGVVYFLSGGRSVHVEDFGTVSVEIGLDGSLHFNFRPDPGLAEKVKSGFRGNIENAENIGKKMADLIALWNADPAHANDQIPTS